MLLTCLPAAVYSRMATMNSLNRNADVIQKAQSPVGINRVLGWMTETQRNLSDLHFCMLGSCLLSLVLGVTLQSCTSFRSQTTYLAQLSSAPECVLRWPYLYVTLPRPATVSSLWLDVSCHNKDNALFLSGRWVASERPKLLCFNLSKMGLNERNAEYLGVYWEDPNRTRHKLAVRRTD